METLPVEMVELIVRLLAPQDLARCSAVCRKWHDIFNQSWMWKPHCDPELEGSLRTTPCIVTPEFVTPEVENSTLSPISCWKLAFMREKHLWKNWRSEELMKCKEENVIKFGNKDLLDVDFLTDTTIVVWYSNRIEVFSVSVIPTFITSITLISIENDKCSVVGTAMLLVDRSVSIEVYDVDIINKSIKLKHNIYLDYPSDQTLLAKEHFYFCMNNEGSILKIFDLNTGKILKEERCQVKVKNRNERVAFWKITCSPTSDFVAVTLVIKESGLNYDQVFCEIYIYNPKELTFLPGPVTDRLRLSDISGVNLHGDWLTFKDYKTFKVYNFQTREVLLSHEVGFNIPIENTYGCNHSLIFWGYGEQKSWIKIYLPSNRTLTTLYESSGVKHFEIINNKFIAIFRFRNFRKVLERAWKLSGQTIEKCDISVRDGCKVNQFFTRLLNKEYNRISGHPTWYISYLW